MNTYICLENLRSLYNVGAIFRTCSFYGFKNVILLGYSGVITDLNNQKSIHPKVSKTSLQSQNDLNITMLNNSDDLKKFATTNNLKIISIEQYKNSQNMHDYCKYNNFENSIIVFGNEVTGVEQQTLTISDHILEIEKKGTHNSLNVTTTCGIVLDSASNCK